MTAKETLFTTYLKAVSNEATGDERIAKSLNIKEFTKHEVIRPAHLIKLIKKHPKIFNIAYGMVIRSWWTLNFLISFSKFLKLFFKKIRVDLFDNATIPAKESFFCIVATPKVLQQLTLVDEDLVPQTWIYIPGIPLQSNLDKNHVRALSLVSYKELVQIFIFSIYAVSFIKRKSSSRYFRLQTYISMEWFITYKALNKICTPGTSLIFGNHYDRWAVLINELPSERKIMLQHGIESKSSSIFPFKINNVDKVICYGPHQRDYFAVILGKDDFEAEYYKHTIRLKSLPLKYPVSILIIGNITLYKKLETELVEGLSSYPVKVFLKPHPVFPLSGYRPFTQYTNFELIHDRNLFPRVDLAISYESTLAYEYLAAGVNVLFYEDRTPHYLLSLIKNALIKTSRSETDNVV